MVNYLISSISLYHTSNVHLSVNKNKIKLKQNQGICFEGSTIKHSVSKIKFGKRVVICLLTDFKVILYILSFVILNVFL